MTIHGSDPRGSILTRNSKKKHFSQNPKSEKKRSSKGLISELFLKFLKKSNEKEKKIILKFFSCCAIVLYNKIKMNLLLLFF